jgi:hypothetical protein
VKLDYHCLFLLSPENDYPLEALHCVLNALHFGKTVVIFAELQALNLSTLRLILALAPTFFDRYDCIVFAHLHFSFLEYLPSTTD